MSCSNPNEATTPIITDAAKKKQPAISAAAIAARKKAAETAAGAKMMLSIFKTTGTDKAKCQFVLEYANGEPMGYKYAQSTAISFQDGFCKSQPHVG